MTPQDTPQDSRSCEVSFPHPFDFAPALFYTGTLVLQVCNLTPLPLQEYDFMANPDRQRQVRPVPASPRSYETFARQPFYEKIDSDLLARAPEVQWVVDFATGTGAAIEHLLELGKLKPGAIVYGVDIDEESLSVARTKFADFLDESPTAVTVRFMRGSVEEIPLPSESQELVTFLNSAHLTNLERSLTEASRLLQKGGSLLLNTAYEAQALPPGSARHWGLMIATARKLAKERGHCDDMPNPVNLLGYSADDYRRIAGLAGFGEIEIEHHTVDMDLPAILAIFGYEGFAQGAMPGVDIDLAISCLQDAANGYFERMKPKGLQCVGRTWMFLEARKT
jgi:SAM-dependent methyltransferase